MSNVANKGSAMSERLIKIVKLIVTLIVFAIWSIVGFVLWIPLLTRMIAYFVSFIAASSFREMNIKHAQDSLNSAIEFYINGFRRIRHVMIDKYPEPATLPTMDNSLPVDFLDFFKSVAADIGWAIIFWVIVSISWIEFVLK